MAIEKRGLIGSNKLVPIEYIRAAINDQGLYGEKE